MTKHRRHVMEQFPEQADRIDELAESNPAFDALCHEFSETSGKLDAVDGGAETIDPAEHDRLRNRRSALEQELLQFMATNLRS